MFFHFQVLFYALTFLAVMELIMAFGDQVVWLGLLLISTTVIGVRRIGKSAIFSIIPITFSVAAVMLLYLIDTPSEQHIFALFGAGIFYLSLLAVYRLRGYKKDQTARGMLSASVMAAMFFCYTAMYGFYLNFSIPLWMLMAFYFVATFGVSFEYFGIVSDEKRLVMLYSLILSMLMAEIAWVTNFWPFGYLTTGVVTLIFYYVFWDLTQMHFLNNLSQKRLASSLLFWGLIIAIVLVTSRWLPAV